MRNKPLTVGMVGETVAALQQALSALGLTIPEAESKRRFFGPGTRAAVAECQRRHGLAITGEVNEATAAALSAMAPNGGIAFVSAAAPPAIASPPGSISPGMPSKPGSLSGAGSAGGRTDKHRVQGRVYFDHGLPAGGVILRLYSRGFGGSETKLGEIKTDAEGAYTLPYDPGGKAANLEVRAVDAQGKEIPLSATKFNAEKREVLNLVAPASVQPPASEYQRLSGDLVRQIGDLNKLAEARESAERQDLTLLHQATHWDARLIGLIAMAVKASAATGIPPEALYALFRAGLPTAQQQLAWISSLAVEKALGKAREAGIVSFSDPQIAGVKAAFETFARATRLAASAPGTPSSFSDLLNKAGTTEATRLSDAEKNIFADLFFAHRGPASELWQKARAQGLSEAKIAGLQLQGKLAYLTLNNASLAESLQRDIGSAENLARLADQDLYSAEAWKTRLNSLANNHENRLKTLIPPAYTGEKTIDRLEAYAADLARKVRLSFPTQVVGRMIEKGELRIGDRPDDVKTQNALTFIRNAAKLGFELGRTPVSAFVKQHEDKVFEGIQPASTLDDAKRETLRSVKTVQRLYQITPTDESLRVLVDQGFKSAYDVVAFPYDVFLDRFDTLFPSRDEARLVYRKAQQISAVTDNLVTLAKQLDSAPPVYAISAPVMVRESVKNELIKYYPTLESLFGSLDFCECEHCRSVLSPAAYFVDLLQFLDPDELVWKNFLDDWKQKHHGKAYDGPEYRYKKPYDALIGRRPDLPHLPLTCENTHTALPYIDLVNEILEYYVAFDKSADFAHDTGAATASELLAEPQNILPDAYGKLDEARYPLTLPFDLWLETVRQFVGHFEMPLWQLLETFRASDELFVPTQPYDRAAIFRESLGLSPAEYAIFTDPNPLAKWYELYSFISEAEAMTVATDADTGQRIDLNSAKALSRRLGVSYKELVDLARTGFVNPRLNVFVILQKLKLDTEDVFRYKRHPTYQAFTAEEQTAFEQRLDDLTEIFKASGFNAKAWLDTAWQNGDFNQLLVLADPNTGCNFDQTTLRYANGDAADTLVFLKINLFVRLWKKLGWTIEETDRALQVFMPKNSLQHLTGANLGEALKTALIYLAHLKALDQNVMVGKNGRLKLLSLWSNLPTTGKNPLYAQLFLTRSVLKNDPVFDDPLGNYLSKAGIPVKDHLPALQGALNLTTDEIVRIFTDVGKDVATAELSLENVSLLYRYGLLAKALKLSVRDLITLKGLSGLDPFKSLKPDPIAVLADDHPFKQTLQFVEVAQKIKDSGFTIEDLDYLLRHRFDPLGKYRTRVDVPLALVKTVASEMHRIQTEQAVPDDPATFTDDVLLLQQRLIRQLIVQTLAVNLTADPALTEVLLSTLLNDPSQPGKPLLDAFAVAGESGISGAFFASTDGKGVPLDTRTVVTADTIGKPAGANSARFEGYFEVPAAGAYRFFAVFGKKDAEVELRLAHLPDPLLRGKAANDGAEISQFAELRPGVPYRFTFDVRNLGGGDVALLVQGENLPKDGLARLTLYPEAAVERMHRARVLLAKALQLIQGLELNEREVRHLLTHGADFDNFDLSKLPTRESDDSPAAAPMLFGQFLRLTDYARLKSDLGGSTDDFVGIFENARRTYPTSADANQVKAALFDDLCQRLADLSRRDVRTVRAAAQHLGFTAQSALAGNELRVEVPNFAQEKGIWRLWEILQAVEKLGIPIDAITRSTEIVSGAKTPEERFGIARDLRNMVKARYEPENWQRIAQPIFDKLRRHQRDALVAYIMHRRGFERMEQLFEYFLIDPGMEPIVQTSRIRLAISSVQLFIQRCLLNLEPQVHPSVINSKHWQWMKRYRVWEANRKIFLFPENWLEPEFRDDKTHLFQELESALLQGDVSNELVEDAFFNYLKKLEELARLDIVAMYCEEKPLDPSSNTLHVIGRTFNLPHKYFYRRYAHQTWTPWEPVTAEIEGDHVVAVVWRERLHLFWVTFLEKAQPNTDEFSKLEDDATVATIAKAVSRSAPAKIVEVQLNWCQYFQGEWTTRESGGFGDPIQAPVSAPFDGRRVSTYVFKEYVNGEERAVRVNLTGAIHGAFRVVSKNSPPKPDASVFLFDLPYPNTGREAARYTGSGALNVTFMESIVSRDDKPTVITDVTEEILGQGGSYSLLTCNDLFAVDLLALIDSFNFDSTQWQKIQFALSEVDSLTALFRVLSADPVLKPLFQWYNTNALTKTLTSPFFYQDEQHTFFVEPTLTETTIDKWEPYVVVNPPPDRKLDDDEWWKHIPIEPMAPVRPFPIDPIGPFARFKIQPREDWIVNPTTVYPFDERLIGQGGGFGITAPPAAIGAGGVGMPTHGIPDSPRVSGGELVIPGSGEAAPGGPRVAVGRLNVVGGGGLNPVMRENVNTGRGPNRDRNLPGSTAGGGAFNR